MLDTEFVSGESAYRFWRLYTHLLELLLLEGNYQMPTFADSRVALPRSWDEFEDIVCSAAKNRWSNPDFTRHGRQGQRQDGVYIYGSDQKDMLVGIQCKNTWSGITSNIIAQEVQKAESFQPRLTALYIATTADTDQAVQGSVREMSAARKSRGEFEVRVLFWSDLWLDLTLNETRLFQHYPQLRPISSGSNLPTHDQKLFQDFQSDFPFEPAVRLLREHNFGDAFSRGAIKPLYRFYEEWDQPEKEFLDSDLQAELCVLHAAARRLSNHLVGKTVPVYGGDLASVYSDNDRASGPRNAHVLEDARVLNEEARIFVPVYENFLRACKKKLG